MPQLKLAATKIPEDWDERIQQLTQETGLTRAEILRQAIGQYLGIETVNAVLSVNQDSDLRAEIQALTARVEALEGLTRFTTPKPAAPPRPRPDKSQDAPSIDGIACKHCGSTDLAKWGLGKLRADGTQSQRYKCNACKKVFTP